MNTSTKYTKTQFDTYFIDCYGYSEIDCKEMDLDEMTNIIEQNADQSDFDFFSA